MKITNNTQDFFSSQSQTVGSLEIATLAQDIKLPEVNTEPITLSLLRYLEEERESYKTKEMMYKSMIGLFFIPVLTPNVLKDDVANVSTTSKQLSGKASSKLNTQSYDITNCIPLIIPRPFVMPFLNVIPKGTKFLITFLGGKIEPSKIKIVGLYMDELMSDDISTSISLSAPTSIKSATNSKKSTSGKINSARNSSKSNTNTRSTLLRKGISSGDNPSNDDIYGALNYGYKIQDYYWNELDDNNKGTIVSDYFQNKNLSIYLPPNYDEYNTYNIFYFKMDTDLDSSSFWNYTNYINNFNYVIDNMIYNKDSNPVIICVISGNESGNYKWLSENALDLFTYVENKYGTYAYRDANIDSLENSAIHRALGGFGLGAIEVGELLKNVRNNDFYKMVKWYDIQSGYNPAGYDSLIGRTDMFIGVVCGDNDESCLPFTKGVMTTFENNSFFIENTDGRPGNYKVQIIKGYTHSIVFQIRYFYNACKFFF